MSDPMNFLGKSGAQLACYSGKIASCEVRASIGTHQKEDFYVKFNNRLFRWPCGRLFRAQLFNGYTKRRSENPCLFLD
jgi:hypothetical protein